MILNLAPKYSDQSDYITNMTNTSYFLYSIKTRRLVFNFSKILKSPKTDFSRDFFPVCGFGVCAAQLGSCLGFILTPWMIRNHENISDIRDDLQFFNYGNAGLATVVTVLVTASRSYKPRIYQSKITNV